MIGKHIRNRVSWSVLFAISLLPYSNCRDSEQSPLDEVSQNRPQAQDLASAAASLIPFDSGVLKGHFRFGHGAEPGKGDFPGVGQCIFTPLNAPLVNSTPPNALLMPEWILKPGGPRDGTPWRLAGSVRPDPIPNGIRIHYPDEELASQGLRFTLEYRVADDMILLDGYIEATREHTNVEILFASYLPNRLNATYVPTRANGEISWRPVPRGEPWKSFYFICSSPETRHWRRDGRVADATVLDWRKAFDPDWLFTAPILVGIEDSSGLAAIHFVDENCSALVGQPHDNDTAHDFTWGWRSLHSEQRIHARAALWITQLHGTQNQRMAQVYEKYQDWRSSWR